MMSSAVFFPPLTAMTGGNSVQTPALSSIQRSSVPNRSSTFVAPQQRRVLENIAKISRMLRETIEKSRAEKPVAFATSEECNSFQQQTVKEEGSLLPISEEEDADENSSIGSGASSWPLTDDEEEHSSSELVPTISACSMHIQRLTATIIPPNTANPQMPVDTTSAMKIYINDSIDRSVLVARLKAASAKLKRDVEIQSAFTFRPTTLTVQGKPTIPSIQIQPPTPEQSAPSPDAISRRPMITNNRALQRQRTVYIALKALELPEKLQKLDAFPVLVGPLPKGWERRELDMGQGKLVPGFASVSTKTVTRIMPGTPDPFDAFVFTDEKGHLGFGWEKTKSFDGSVCYVNHLSGETQKKRPESELDPCVVPQKDIINVLRELKADADSQGRKLPDLWSRQVGRFGIPFYVNRAQKVVTLKNPLNFTPLHLQILNTLPEQSQIHILDF